MSINEIIEKIKNADCCICLEPYIDNSSINVHLIVRGCNHIFHKICLKKAKATGGIFLDQNGKYTVSNPCPICRQEIYGKSIGLFIDKINSLDKKNSVHIRLCTPRGDISSSDLFVDENIKMRQIMNVCGYILGYDTTSKYLFPKPFIYGYSPRLKYSSFFDDNDKILSSFGIKNGNYVELYFIFKYI